jgi:hypothetical protein
MLYTVGYRGFTIWRKSEAEPFRISRTEARDIDTLKTKLEPGTFWSFSAARREVDYLR